MSSESKQQKKPSLLSPLFAPIGMAFNAFLYIITSIVLGTIIDYFGIYMGWWTTDHQFEILKSDIQYLGDNFTTSVFGAPPAEIAINISQTIQGWLTLSTHIPNQQFEFMRAIKDAAIAIEPFWQNLVYSAMTVGVRCFIIVMSIGFFIIVFVVCSVDGLVQRELRKEGGGIEHAQIYHHAKIWVGRILIISPVVYLSWPETINPGIIILPAAFGFGMATFITFSTFKKHL